MWSSLALFANQRRFDFGTLYFRQLFWKAHTYCVYISGEIDALFVKLANGLAQTWGQLLWKSNLLHTITLEIVQLNYNYNYMAFGQSN